MATDRIIKKYPNRRLYDTAISKYVTLEDISRLVKDGTRFHIVEAKTGEDITRPILLQIIVEQEEKGEPIFTADLLQQIIRTYGDTMQGLMTGYLEESMDFFMRQQKAMQEQMADLVKNAPVSVFGDLAQRNLGVWQSMQEELMKAYGVAAQQRPPKDAGEKSE